MKDKIKYYLLLLALKEFPHIGLLVSVRTQYEDSLFDGQDTLRAQMV